jgi:hypothetical protein
MVLPNPGVLDVMIRDRQNRLRTKRSGRAGRPRAALRVRIGHALIVAGSSLSGERLEQPARRSALPRSA